MIDVNYRNKLNALNLGFPRSYSGFAHIRKFEKEYGTSYVVYYKDLEENYDDVVDNIMYQHIFEEMMKYEDNDKEIVEILDEISKSQSVIEKSIKRIAQLLLIESKQCYKPGVSKEIIFNDIIDKMNPGNLYNNKYISFLIDENLNTEIKVLDKTYKYHFDGSDSNMLHELDSAANEIIRNCMESYRTAIKNTLFDSDGEYRLEISINSQKYFDKMLNDGKNWKAKLIEISKKYKG